MKEILVKATTPMIIVTSEFLFDAELEKEAVEGEDFDVASSPPLSFEIEKGVEEEDEEEHPTALIDLIYKLSFPPTPSPQMAIVSISSRVSMSGQTLGSSAQVIF